jgi:hypothetical protein
MNILPCIVAIVISLVAFFASRKTWEDMILDVARMLFFAGVFWLLYVLTTHPHGMAMGMSFRGVIQ